MATEKIFLGKVVPHTFPNGGEILKVSFNTKDMETLTANVKKGYVNLLIKKSKTKGTYYVEIDTWEPTKQAEPEPKDDGYANDLPF